MEDLHFSIEYNLLKWSGRYAQCYYMGKINDNDLSKIDTKTIDVLIKENIFIKPEMSITMRHKLFFDLDSECKESDSSALDNRIYRNSIEYILNPDVSDDMFLLLQYYIEEDNYPDDEIDELFFKVNAILGKKKKIKYLKKQYKKIFPKDSDFMMYSTSIDDDSEKFGISEAWYDIFCEYLFKDQQIFIKSYLTTNFDNSDMATFIEVVISTIQQENEIPCYNLKNFIKKWKIFYVKDCLLKNILWKIRVISDPESIELPKGIVLDEPETKIEKVSDFDSCLSDLSGTEMAYYIYYTEYANEKVVEYDRSSEAEQTAYWSAISKIYNKNITNVRKTVGLIKDEQVRLKPTSQREKMFKNFLPFLSENAKKHCLKELNILTKNL
ncbi:hypothetical protein [Bizionia sp.]|uniref:hypothetical protein n=1 Tax=Bizionia sp. TaxID=1954480 RepID=UPI003A935359